MVGDERSQAAWRNGSVDQGAKHTRLWARVAGWKPRHPMLSATDQDAMLCRIEPPSKEQREKIIL
jgi:hypothetical protein